MSGSSRFAIAVHTLAALGYLERQGVPRASSQLLARSVNTNPVAIRNLLLALKKAKLVRSKEGKEGGVSLALDASQITLAAIYTAVEKESLLRQNQKPEHRGCPVSRGIKGVLHPIFDDVDRAVHEALRRRTLKHVIDSI